MFPAGTNTRAAVVLRFGPLTCGIPKVIEVARAGKKSLLTRL